MATSETSKYRHITAQYCQGAGIDIGSSGDPVVAHAIQIDLPEPYCPLIGPGPIHLRGFAADLKWFKNQSLDFVYSSHLIEDFPIAGWTRLLEEWHRILKIGGHMIILAPEETRWQAALALGQPPNDAHKHEPRVGELTLAFTLIFGNEYEVIMDECPDPNDYGLVFIARKLA
jgi:hypothetical protein